MAALESVCAVYLEGFTHGSFEDFPGIEVRDMRIESVGDAPSVHRVLGGTIHHIP